VNQTMNSGSAVKGFDEMPAATVPEDDAGETPAFLARMAMEHGPVFRRPTPRRLRDLYGPWTAQLVGPEANRFVLHTQRDAFSHEQGWAPILGPRFAQGLLNTDGPPHDRARAMMNPAFAVAYMTAYLPLMDRIIAARTRDWAARGTVDLYEEARKITFDVAAEALVGLRAGAEVDRLCALFYALIRGDNATGASPEARVAAATRARAELDGLLLRLIAARRAAPADDILGLLTRARDEEGRPFSETHLLGHVHILLVAGHETTTTLSAWLLYLLATHPAYLARVHAEMDEVLSVPGTDGALTLRVVRAARVLGYAVDEAGRLRSPVCNAPRVTVREVAFGGYALPEETRVLLGLAAGHQLPRVFADPDRFDPDRFAPPRVEDKATPYGLVTFGGGPRVCIGMNFARVEIVAMALRVLRSYTLTPIEGQAPVHRCDGIIASLPHGLPVHVTAR